MANFGARDFGDVGAQQENARRNDEHRQSNEQERIVATHYGGLRLRNPEMSRSD